MNERGPLFQVLALGVVFVMLALLLAPTSASAIAPVVAVSDGLAALGAPWWLASVRLWEVLFNVALFMPVGVLGVMLFPGSSVRTWALVGFAVSASVETTQALLLADRVASVIDVVANTLGAWLGARATRSWVR